MTTATEPRADERFVLMSAEQHAEIECHIVELIRANKNELASTMMNLALAYKFAPARKPDSLDRVLGRLREDAGVSPQHPTLTLIPGGRDA